MQHKNNSKKNGLKTAIHNLKIYKMNEKKAIGQNQLAGKGKQSRMNWFIPGFGKNHLKRLKIEQLTDMNEIFKN